MGRLVYLAVGGLAGIALSENKELVGEITYRLAELLKLAAQKSLDLEFQETKFKDLPVLGYMLRYASAMNVDRAYLQMGVDSASAMGKGALRHVETAVGSNKSPSGPIRSTVGSFAGGKPWTTGNVMFYGMIVTIPAFGIYVMSDEPMRKKLILFSQDAKINLYETMEKVRAKTFVLYSHALTESPKLYKQIATYTENEAPKLVNTAREKMREQLSSTRKMLGDCDAVIRSRAPKIYQQLRTKGDLYYIELVAVVQNLAARSQAWIRNYAGPVNDKAKVM